MFKRNLNLIATVAVAIALASCAVASASAPASADTITSPISGYTPDDGNGNSITMTGTSTTNNDRGVDTTEVDTTTTWRDRNGNVIKVVKHHRKVQKYPRGDKVVDAKDETTTPNPDGTSTIVIEEQFDDATQHDSETTKKIVDGTGKVIGGEYHQRLTRDGKTEKNDYKWDPKLPGWVVSQAPHRKNWLLPALGLGLIVMEAMHGHAAQPADQPQPQPQPQELPR